MLKKFRADLHIHTCLSPCADLRMTPSAIIKAAVENRLDIIAVTDHNSAENVIHVIKAAEETEVKVLAGMEVASSEEAHILAIFDDVESVFRLQDNVYENMLSGEHDSEKFGHQIVVNTEDEVLDFNKRRLITATALTVSSLVDMIRSLGGLAIASHIDKEVFSIISQLGFIPPDLKFDALEMSSNINREKADDLFMDYIHSPWISSSDAHYLEDIGKRTTDFFITEPTLSELRSALGNIKGRKAEWK